MSSERTPMTDTAAAEKFLDQHEGYSDTVYHFRDYLLPSPVGTLSVDKIPQNLKVLVNKLKDRMQRFSRTFYKPDLPCELQARYHYLVGKDLAIFEEYSEEANEHLQKAVKLNPNIAKAWFCLSIIDSKKGCLVEAKQNLEKATNLLAGASDMDIACENFFLKAKLVLAMLKGNPIPGFENESIEQLSRKCIQDAKEAVEIDVRTPPDANKADGKGWYCLANAYLINWFATGCGDVGNLSNSVNAFKKVGWLIKSSASYNHNFGLASKYFGDYAGALSIFWSVVDTYIDTERELKTIVALLESLDLLRGRTTTSVSTDSKNAGTLNVLKEGPNKGKKIRGEVKYVLENENGPMLHFLVSTRDKIDNFVLLIYGVRKDVIRVGDRLTLHDPYFRDVKISWERRDYNYYSIFLDSPDRLLLNEKPLKDEEKKAVAVQNTIQIYYSDLVHNLLCAQSACTGF